MKFFGTRFVRLSSLFLVFAVVSAGATCLAEDVTFPTSGTVVTASPMFWLRDSSRTPIILLPAGAAVEILGGDSAFYEVVFHDPRFGDQTGYVSIFDVKIEPRDVSQSSSSTGAEAVSERGFVEGQGFGFPQASPHDAAPAVGDILFRQELFFKPSRVINFSAGIDLRGNSHDQVEHNWRLNFDDRSPLRPRAAIRRLSVGVTTRRVTVDLGKQFIRWGRADILSPTDRFAPRDYLNVIATEFLPVLGARASVHAGSETFETVWLPRMTPSRVPLLSQRWTVVPPEAAGLLLRDRGAIFPSQGEQGARWTHGGRFEMGLSFFNGFNHLPDINAAVDPIHGTVDLTRVYSALRSYGTELSIPTSLVTVKGEAAYFTSPTSTSEEYVLYVVEVERQVGEWLLDGGYAGEVVTKPREGFGFASERGVARSIIGRASYTVDPRRTIAAEAAVRQNGRGLYTKGEFSEAFGQHWRLTLAAVGIAGKDDDFLGQYHRNSHASMAFRLSF